MIMQSTVVPMLSLDPALLADTYRSDSKPDDDDDEYEYEYSETDTETFYLNVDLSSYHGPLRPPRRRQDPTASHVSSQFTSPSARGSPNPRVPADHDGTDTTATSAIRSDETDRVQILGLHTSNPIVSYQNHVFSCSWADLLGTELLFTHPEPPPLDEDSELEPSELTYLRRGKDYALIAANSVKLLGRKANLISSTPSSTNTNPPPPLPSTTTTTPTPVLQSNQARFLDRLRLTKQAKGETDTVRTVFNLRRAQNQDLQGRLRGWAKTEDQLAELDRLNRAVLEGDADALARLERIYKQYEGGSKEGGEGGVRQASGEEARSQP